MTATYYRLSFYVVLTIRKGTLQEILEMTNLATLLIALFCIRLAIYKSAAPSPILNSWNRLAVYKGAAPRSQAPARLSEKAPPSDSFLP